MRSNLLSLQNTVKLLDRTQERLSTGKKVNTAIDNPVSFFAAQSLNSRASVIDSLKDAMGQAVQTVKAADKGITAITAMIEQAKGIAQSALSAPADSGQDTGTITLTQIDVDDVINIGGITFTAVTTAPAATGQFLASGNSLIDTISLAAAINDQDWSGEVAAFSATVKDGVLSISKTDNTTNEVVDVVAGDFSYTPNGGGVATMAVTESTSGELASLQAQFNTMLQQIDDLAADSGYKGKNLLAAAVMTVKFEGSHTLDVQGFDASTAGLSIGAAAWATEAAIDASIVELDNAAVTLRSEASKLSGNLSIITVRQDFSDNMINTLTEGADKLTLADTNEEGANMLMLQTRQSLSTTALSLSAQAAQSVLRLFG
jgi:flagellin-like hook-associated protein FlgL